MDLDQPIHEYAAHLLVDVGLLLHVVTVCLVVQFGVETVLVHVYSLECTVECIGCILHVTCLAFALEVD